MTLAVVVPEVPLVLGLVSQMEIKDLCFQADGGRIPTRGRQDLFDMPRTETQDLYRCVGGVKRGRVRAALYAGNAPV